MGNIWPNFIMESQHLISWNRTQSAPFHGHAFPLQWRHNERNGISNHQPHDCLLNRLFRRRSKKTWKLRVTGLCEGNSPVTGEFPAQRARNAENVSIWWRHHAPHWHWVRGIRSVTSQRDDNAEFWEFSGTHLYHNTATWPWLGSWKN